MKSNNKKRILALIQILQKNSDMDHKLTLNQIVSYLEEQGINIQNRKTLYDDFKVLNEFGYEVEYDNGYFLLEAPFSLSEIKIIIDSINSLKNLDNTLLTKISNKLYSFISIEEESLLKRLAYHNKHSDKKFINRLEDILDSLKTNTNIIIKRTNKNEVEEIRPLFLFRSNDFYYLYYQYLDNEKIYHVRFDNIISTKLTSSKNNANVSKAKIIETIEESTNAYFTDKASIINFEIIKDSDYLRQRLLDDFSNIVFTSNGFSIKASINNVFFSKLTSYNDEIRIVNKDVAKDYIVFLNKIIQSQKV